MKVQRKVKKRKACRKSYLKVKRIMGFCSSLLLLILLFPLMLLLAILIKIDSEGPAIFKQIRIGKNGKKFYVYKFRTMIVNNNVLDFEKEDEHTRIGKILRKLSLDELPQLFNILKGDMAFIGPRPWIPEYYENMTITQRHRQDILPGITGLAQIKGRNNISIDEKINYDLEYVKKCSLLQDIKIVFLTIVVVLSKKGADAGKAIISNEIQQLKNNTRTNEEIDVKELISAG